MHVFVLSPHIPAPRHLSPFQTRSTISYIRFPLTCFPIIPHAPPPSVHSCSLPARKVIFSRPPYLINYSPAWPTSVACLQLVCLGLIHSSTELQPASVPTLTIPRSPINPRVTPLLRHRFYWISECSPFYCREAAGKNCLNTRFYCSANFLPTRQT